MFSPADFEFDDEDEAFEMVRDDVLGESRVVPFETTVDEADDGVQVDGGVMNGPIETLAIEMEDMSFEDQVGASSFDQKKLASTAKRYMSFEIYHEGIGLLTF